MDAFTRLDQQSRVESAQAGLEVVHRDFALETKYGSHRLQMRGIGIGGHAALRAEKKQVAQQGFGDLRARTVRQQARELQQHAGSGPFDIDIKCRQGPQCQCFKKSGRHPPESSDPRRVSTSRQAGTQAHELLGGGVAVGLDDQQDEAIEHGAQGSIGLQCLGHILGCADVARSTVKQPEI